MSKFAKLHGKQQAMRSLVQFMWWFRNWKEVFDGYRGRSVMPPLQIRSGPTLFHEPSDDAIGLFREVFIDRCYAGADFYDPKPHHVVLDLGANIGTTMLYLSWRAPGIRIHCFEPMSRTRSKLEENVRKNRLEKPVTIHAEAISDHNGLVRLYSAASSKDGSTIPSEFTSAETTEEANCITLQEARTRCDLPHIDLLKIDVEGAEIEILSANPEKSLAGVDRVAVEFHDHFRPGCLDSIQRALRLSGFANPTVEYSADGRPLGILRAKRRL